MLEHESIQEPGAAWLTSPVTSSAAPARVADEGELADVDWVKLSAFSTFVPYGFVPVVENYFKSALATTS